MYSILIPENLWRQNSIILEYLCRVHKIKHTETRNLVECFIEAHSKGDGRPNGVTGRHLCRVPDLCRGPFCLAHGKSLLCRVLQLCRVPVLVAHGKPCLCRVPDVLHTANVSAHGKHMVSGSVHKMQLTLPTLPSNLQATNLFL